MIFRLMAACSFDDGLADVASGTTTQIISADVTVRPARIPNSPRQPPLQSSNSSAGEGALSAPRAPTITTQPFMKTTRPFWNPQTIPLINFFMVKLPPLAALTPTPPPP